MNKVFDIKIWLKNLFQQEQEKKRKKDVVLQLNLQLKEKNIKLTQGKLPKVFFHLMEDLRLADIQRQKNGNSGEYTQFSERQILEDVDMI